MSIDKQIAMDKFGRFWFGYDHGEDRMWSWEDSDTDMGDLSTHELEESRGPLMMLSKEQHTALYMQREIEATLSKVKRLYGKDGLKYMFDRLTEFNDKIGFTNE